MSENGTLDGLSDTPELDRSRIAATLQALQVGFLQRVALLEGIYIDDADWINAFGSMKHGNRQIVDYLAGLFADQSFDDGQLAGPPASKLRRISATAAVVSTHLQSTGQCLVDGGTIPLHAPRDNHSLHLLQKQDDDAWQISSEMYSDTRPDQTYIHHS